MQPKKVEKATFSSVLYSVLCGANQRSEKFITFKDVCMCVYFAVSWEKTNCNFLENFIKHKTYHKEYMMSGFLDFLLLINSQFLFACNPRGLILEFFRIHCIVNIFPLFKSIYFAYLFNSYCLMSY